MRLKSTSTTVAQAITDMWYNGEVSAYPSQDFGQPNPDLSNFEAWGHFSQVVWVASEQVGCATQYCPPGTIYADLGSYYTVCDYYPPGKSKTLCFPAGEKTNKKFRQYGWRVWKQRPPLDWRGHRGCLKGDFSLEMRPEFGSSPAAWSLLPLCSASCCTETFAWFISLLRYQV